ncbi:MAG: hypothetical protein FWH46_03055 [Methanimicrococcus sp.]|nr:hypothetical protein [Methanimicrococcus sp.]
MLTGTGFITGVLGLITIFGFKSISGILGLSHDFGYLLLDKMTLFAFIIIYIVYQYAGIKLIYKEGIKDIDEISEWEE